MNNAYPHTMPRAAWAARRRGTGESWQALATAEARPEIPEAADSEQAWLETELLLGRFSLGRSTAHPMGIVRVKPEPHLLTVQLVCEPFVVRTWAEQTVPWLDESLEDPCDAVSGVAGMRWRCHGQGVDLTRPGSGAAVRLTGFPSRWWARAVAGRARDGQVGRLVSEAGWTAAERAADAGRRALRGHAPHIGSALLRRIRATAGTGPANGAVAWCDVIGRHSDWIVETLDGPPCSVVIPLFTNGPTGTGWQLELQTCHCGDDVDAGCVAVFRAGDRQEVWYRNLNWRRIKARTARSAAAATESNPAVSRGW